MRTLLHLAMAAIMSAAWALGGMQQAAAFDYSPFTYTVTENGVTTTYPLTRPATTTEQIKALLFKIYSDVNIPGFKQYDHYELNGETGNYVYTETRHVLYPPYANYGISGRTGDYPYAPNEEGITALLIQVDDTLEGNPMEDMDDITWPKIKSARLLDHTVQISTGPNPGTLINVKDDFNKFFIISKGRPERINQMEFGPLKMMFEELSPAITGTPNPENIHRRLEKGETFPVDHSCASVLVRGHITFMLSKVFDRALPSRNMNLMFYIPDDRFMKNTTWKGTYDNQYDPEHQPYYFIYFLAQSNPQLIDRDLHARTEKVNLSWHSSLKDITRDSTVYEEYRIYSRKVGSTTWQPVPANKITVTQDSTTFDATTGLIARCRDGNLQATITEPIDADNVDIEYMIDGRIKEDNGSAFEWIRSDDKAVEIEGYDIYTEPRVRIALDHTSTFDLTAGVNHYDNTIHVLQNTGVPLLRAHMSMSADEPTSMQVVRYVVTPGTSDNPDITNPAAGTVVASANLIPVATAATVAGQTMWPYVVTTTSETTTGAIFWPNDGRLYSVTAGTTAGDNAATVRTLAQIRGGSNDDLLTIRDQFDCPLAQGVDRQQYVYRVFFSHVNAIDYPEGIRSNFVVTTPAGYNLTSGYSATYTANDVTTDTDRHLAPSHVAIKVETVDNSLIDNAYIIDSEAHVLGNVVRDPQTGRNNIYTVTNDIEGTVERQDQLDDIFEHTSCQATPAMQGQQVYMVTHLSNGNTYGSPRVIIPCMPTIDIELDGNQNSGQPLTWADGNIKIWSTWEWQYDPATMPGLKQGTRAGMRGWANDEAVCFYDGFRYPSSASAPRRRVTASSQQWDGRDRVTSKAEIATAQPSADSPACVDLIARHYIQPQGSTNYLVTEGSGAWLLKDSGTVTGLESLADNGPRETGRYNEMGMPVGPEAHGLVIIRYDDGTAAKHIIP